MAKKKARRPGGAAGMAVIEDELEDAANDAVHESNGMQSDSEVSTAKPERKTKVKPDHQATGHFGVSDIKSLSENTCGS